MLLNPYIIRDYTSLPLQGRFLSDRGDRKLSYPVIWNGQPDFQKDILYLCSAADAQRIQPTDGCILVSGTPSVKLLQSNLDILYTETELPMEELINEMCRIFSFFNEFEKKLGDICYSDQALQAICNTLLELVRNPICISTNYFQNICVAERKGNLKNCHFTKDSLLFPTKEAVDELTLHPDFAATLNTVGPQTFPSDLTGYRILYQNIYYNERSVARLLICETEFPFRDSDYTLTAVAVKYIEKAFSHRNDNSFFLHPPQLTRLFQNLISGELMSENDLQNTIQPLGWHINDTFVCFHIVSNMKKAGTFLNTCLSLEKKIRYSIAIPVKDSIFYVVDLTASNLSRRDLMGILIYDFRESLLKAGISSEYTNLAETVFFYRQASIALDYGSVQNPQIWTYYFDDYALDYALSQIETSIPAWCFCNRKLKKLIQYDRENKRSYTRSLQVYLENNMSVAKTIRVLYLQRQTFLYHLKRIEEITGLNLNDYPTRLYLQLSFQLLKRSSVDLNGNN